ncbi:MAG: RDD family protein [Bdellovibrionota bacterium]
MSQQPIRSFNHYEPTRSGIWRRSLAYHIDTSVLSVFLTILALIFITRDSIDFIKISITLTLFLFLYDWLTHAYWHASLGKMITGIVVKNKDHTEPGGSTYFLRTFVKLGFCLMAIPFLNAIPALLTLISALLLIFSPSKQTIHDKIAQTQAFNVRPMRLIEGLAIYFTTLLVWLILIVAILGMFGKSLQTSFQDLMSQQDTLYNKVMKIPTADEGVEKQEDKSLHFKYNNLVAMQYIDEGMYKDALQNIQIKDLNIDQDLAQYFEKLVVMPERMGMNKIKLHFYLPLIPNLQHYLGSTHLHIDPILASEKRQIKHVYTQPKFEVLKQNDKEFFYGASILTYSGKPFHEVRVNISLKLPISVRKIEILSGQIKSKYQQYDVKITDASFLDQAMQFKLQANKENYLGMLAYTSDSELIEIFDEYVDQKSSGTKIYDYNFSLTPYRTELFIAKNFFTMDLPALIKTDKTYIRTHDHYISFYPQPKTFLKKSIAGIHEIKTQKYDVSIKNSHLTINSLDFGKIHKDDWIHIEGKKIFLNGNPLN